MSSLISALTPGRARQRCSSTGISSARLWGDPAVGISPWKGRPSIGSLESPSLECPRKGRRWHSELRAGNKGGEGFSSPSGCGITAQSPGVRESRLDSQRDEEQPHLSCPPVDPGRDSHARPWPAPGPALSQGQRPSLLPQSTGTLHFRICREGHPGSSQTPLPAHLAWAQGCVWHMDPKLSHKFKPNHLKPSRLAPGKSQTPRTP